MADTSGRPSSSLSTVVPRRLRRRLTPQEAKLWNLLRERFRGQGRHFRRQVPIERFVVDFACLRARLVIEIDGGGHGHEAQAEQDRLRDARLEELGFRVLRLWNIEVDRETEAVLDRIAALLGDEPTTSGG